MIGVDPHKGSHTAPMLDRDEVELRRIKVRAGGRHVAELLEWADGVRPRTWAIESAGGMGHLLAQQLVAAGETVVNVPATLASRVRVLASGQSTKSDPNDARSVAVAALRAPSLRSGRRRWRRSGQLTTPRCAGCWSSITTIWLVGATSCAAGCTPSSANWCLVASTAKWSSPQARSLLEGIEPDDVAAAERRRQAVELVAEIDRLDSQMRDSRTRITAASRAPRHR
jgi:hypothetical protein